MAALKEIRHSAQLPATLAHYAYKHQRARERKSSGRITLLPREVRTAVCRSFRDVWRERIPTPCIGRWSSAITHLTGMAHLRYLKDDKEISVIVRNPANR